MWAVCRSILFRICLSSPCLSCILIGFRQPAGTMRRGSSRMLRCLRSGNSTLVPGAFGIRLCRACSRTACRPGRRGTAPGAWLLLLCCSSIVRSGILLFHIVRLIHRHCLVRILSAGSRFFWTFVGHSSLFCIRGRPGSMACLRSLVVGIRGSFQAWLS